ncbi:tRNA 2-thiouridine(34) synthase MnmA [Candidatus Saccharibacteria bacterium]|nr:MAG: tRNA 2-thiouridine(34) synthase MnmA [Candidatus Saccharibacteria bacterium]
MRVFVGLSGGVDSSLTAALLVEQGYDVTGVYMKNWSQDLPGMKCPWQEDYQDAKRVAVQLGIPFKLYDFEAEYREKVVDYMLDGYQRGITPNPDIMCNQEVKFKLFLEAALADGADMIATGHYARVVPSSAAPNAASLHMAANLDKDQTYFLYRVTKEALGRSLMPIGEFTTKAEVRAEAEKRGLATARKKDSQGICFVGKVGIKDFLLHELGEQPHGDILDQNCVRIGEHDGAIFYTIGQRQGLGVGGGLPYYVTGKNMAKNEVYVTTDLQDSGLWCDTLHLAELHWINEPPQPGKTYQVRTRYRAELVPATFTQDDQNNRGELHLEQAVRAVTPGQSAVLYDNTRVLGGGIAT